MNRRAHQGCARCRLQTLRIGVALAELSPPPPPQGASARRSSLGGCMRSRLQPGLQGLFVDETHL
ncbi:MAG TPA: hypothetical protein PKB14_03770 [Rubrivivax sp.]|nr:hypothetical protein [Rubrivivax sp.]